MQEAYIIAGFRTAVTKSKKGGFRFTRPDDLAIELIKGLMASVPSLDPMLIDDVIVGNAVPEAEQGLQFGRIIAARAIGVHTAGITINRYCASGLESTAMATAQNQKRYGRMHHCRRNGKHELGSHFRMENCSCIFHRLRRTRLLFKHGPYRRSGCQRV